MVPHTSGLSAGQDPVSDDNGSVEFSQCHRGAVAVYGVDHERNSHDAKSDIPKEFGWDEGECPKHQGGLKGVLYVAHECDSLTEIPPGPH